MTARSNRYVLVGALLVATLIAWAHAIDAIRGWLG